MIQVEMNTRSVRAFAWSGIILILAMLIGFIPLMHFTPPPSPAGTRCFVSLRPELEVRFPGLLGIVLAAAELQTSEVT